MAQSAPVAWPGLSQLKAERDLDSTLQVKGSWWVTKESFGGGSGVELLNRLVNRWVWKAVLAINVSGVFVWKCFLACLNWSHSLENRHLPCCLWTVVVGPGLPHMQSCRMTLLLCFPCWCSAPVPELLPASNHLPYRESGQSAPVLRQPLTWARQGQCLLESGKGEGHLPCCNSLSQSTIHVGTEVLWGSALPAAISGPCSPVSGPFPAQESCRAASLACSDVQCWTWGPSVSSTLPFLHLPFEETVADAFWCFSAFLGVGKRESWCL